MRTKFCRVILYIIVISSLLLSIRYIIGSVKDTFDKIGAFEDLSFFWIFSTVYPFFLGIFGCITVPNFLIRREDKIKHLLFFYYLFFSYELLYAMFHFYS